MPDHVATRDPLLAPEPAHEEKIDPALERALKQLRACAGAAIARPPIDFDEGQDVELEEQLRNEPLDRQIAAARRLAARGRYRDALQIARSARELAHHGELLKGVLSRVRRGDRELVARDHATGEDVTIVLDPTKSPAENLDHLFRRYQKAVRKLAKGGAQQDASVMHGVSKWLDDSIIGVPEIEAFKAELAAKGMR